MTLGFSLHFDIVAVAVAVLLFIGSSASAHDVIKTLSGQDVPVALIQKHFVRKLTLSDHKRNIVYELNEKNVLRGPGLHLDLRWDVFPVLAKRSQASFTVNLNGVAREFSPASLTTLRGKSYNIIVDNASGRILSVSGNGIVLSPVHKTRFPGIFVNKRAFSNRHVDLGTDLHVLARKQDKKDFRKDDLMVVHEEGTVLSSSRGASEFENAFTSRQTSGSCASGSTHYLEIAVAYDNTFCGLYDNDEPVATRALQDVIRGVNEAYGRDTCVQLALVHVEAHCNDPADPYEEFQGFTPEQILNNFQSIWIESRQDIVRDAAYIVTGFQDGTSVAGIAYISAACSTRNGYGWIEGPSSVIFAHEVGHTLGGSHTSTGIMGAVAMGGPEPTFSADSVQQFSNYIDSFAASACMETTRPAGTPPGTLSPTTTTTEGSPTIPVATPQPVPPTPEVPVSTPPSLPDEPSVGMGLTCESGFSRSAALTCRGRRLRLITFSSNGEEVGKLRISIQQRSGQFVVRYRASDRLYISTYRDLVTTDRSLLESSNGSLGEFEAAEEDGMGVETTWNANSMPKLASETTCCGKELYMSSEISLCLKSDDGGEPPCRTIAENYSTSIGCKNVCRTNTSGMFIAMSADQECPSCE